MKYIPSSVINYSPLSPAAGGQATFTRRRRASHSQLDFRSDDRSFYFLCSHCCSSNTLHQKMAGRRLERRITCRWIFSFGFFCGMVDINIHPEIIYGGKRIWSMVRSGRNVVGASAGNGVGLLLVPIEKQTETTNKSVEFGI
ncbi:MAG: hypothetical protein HY800_00010 [Ignavibacteriales bacterium]|nr:hypothetical protein [Ignavibacteriales bacterium]